MKRWKESATLIVLARSCTGLPKQEECGYKVLVLKRSAKTGFMPSSTVFPGGMIEKCDSSRDWLALYESLGVSLNNLTEVTAVHGERPPIFQNVGDDELKKEISLRITCIRETFEELGVLICRDKTDLTDTEHATEFASFKSGFDIEHWQKKVHEDPEQFLELCHEQEIVPDVWGTHEWSAWLTPTWYKNKRFEAAFYLAALDHVPEVHAEINEVQSYMWKSPLELMAAHTREEQWLPPPQYYELSRLAGVADVDKLARFAKQRSSKGSVLFFPISLEAKDGSIHLLPGDEHYPEKPDMQTGKVDRDHKGELTMEAQRPDGPVHRTEHGQSPFEVKLVVKKFQPHCEHLKPVVIDNQTDSKL